MGRLDQAIQSHTLWRIKLLDAIQEGKPIDAAACESQSQCDLGRWLSSEEAIHSNAPVEVSQLRIAHTLFHQLAGEIAMLVESKQIAEARHSIFQGAFHQGMLGLISAVENLKAREGKKEPRLRQTSYAGMSQSDSRLPTEWETRHSKQRERMASIHALRALQATLK